MRNHPFLEPVTETSPLIGTCPTTGFPLPAPERILSPLLSVSFDHAEIVQAAIPSAAPEASTPLLGIIDNRLAATPLQNDDRLTLSLLGNSKL
jgi:hypothetical protein